MNIQTIAEHSLDIDLITPTSKVLDLGARAFTWSREMLYLFNLDRIYCIDADNEVKSPDERFVLKNVAIGPDLGRQPFIKYGNGTGNYISDGNELRPRECKMEFVDVWTIDQIGSHFGVEWWDLIKFDVENSELAVLGAITEPIATQLSIEWHMHTKATIGQVMNIRQHLEQWYTCEVWDLSEKHGAGLNVWDSLFILKPEYRKS